MIFDQNLRDVGPGWHPILRALDECFHYVFAEDESLAKKLEVWQVKEKLGGLRVYINQRDFPAEVARRLHDFILMAETMSFNLCEQCGATDVEKRIPCGTKMGWIKTLCQKHHEERDAKWEDVGVGKPSTDLSTKQKDLLRRIRQAKKIYAEDLCPGDRVRAEFLERRGLVRSSAGVWSGKKFYRKGP